jgi:chromosome partitioning protein
MSAHVIAIAATKGGVGKTTIAGLIGVCAVAEGEQVTLVDAEPQQSLGLWYERRGQPDNPKLVTAKSEGDLTRIVGRLRAGADDWVIIDTPPAIVERIEAAIGAADLIIIPVRASIFDVEAISPVVELCKDYGKPYVFVISHADPKWKLLPSVIDALSDYGPVLTEQIRYHDAYPTAVTTGKTAAEMKGKAGADAREEAAALWKAVKRRLGKKGR